MNNQLLTIGIWTKVVLFVLCTILIVTFLLLNMSAVVEPRVHLVFTTFERPGLLVVLLLTSLLGMGFGWLAPAVFRTVRQFREAQVRSSTIRQHREIKESKDVAGGKTDRAVAS